MTDSLNRPIYDCIEVRPYGEQQIPMPVEETDDKGEVDNESEADDSDLDEDEWMDAVAAGLIPDDYAIILDSREGSPMDSSWGSELDMHRVLSEASSQIWDQISILLLYIVLYWISTFCVGFW